MSLEQPTAVLSAVECVGDKRPPSGLVNAFAHGFELLLRLFQKSPPSSITRFVATCSLGLHLATGVRQVWLQGHEYFRIFFMSSISIEAGSSTSEQRQVLASQARLTTMPNFDGQLRLLFMG